MVVNQMRTMVQNALSFSRDALLRRNEIDPRRSINDECGFPEDIKLTDYREMYNREGIATRVVEVMPKESWKTQPTVFETQDVDEETSFEKAFAEMGDALQPEEKSFFKSEEGRGNPIWEYLLRADELSGIGHYGVLLLGLDDEKELDQEVKPKEGMKLLFVRAFDELFSQITRYETDKENPRFGKPVMYQLTFHDQQQNVVVGTTGEPLATKSVHWTRIIHLADNLASNELFGRPRQQSVFNNILSLRKVIHGSAEMYWKGAFPGLSIESIPQLGPNVIYDRSAMRDDIENWQNGLQRVLTFTGFHANSLQTQVSDPTTQFEIQIDTICIRIGIPKRVFVGSERGELSSSQDARAWNGRLTYRQQMYITPRIIVPFVNRLIHLGVLPEPQDGYGVSWPDLDTLTNLEKADVALKITEALTKYIQGSGDALIEPLDYLTRVLNFTTEEAEEMIEAANKAVGDLMIPLEDPADVAARAEQDKQDGFAFEAEKQDKAIGAQAAGQAPKKKAAVPKKDVKKNPKKAKKV